MTTPLTTAEIVERLRKGIQQRQKHILDGDGNAIGLAGYTFDVDATAALMSEAASALLALEGERDEARQIVRDTYWMALRYADGRKSYAVGMCNDAVQKAYDAGWITPKDAGGDPITPRLARDGMSPEWTNITARLEAAEAELAKVRSALEPFGDIDGEGDEDFPDDTPVIITFGRSTVYSVTLGDFRRARAALSGKTV